MRNSRSAFARRSFVDEAVTKLLFASAIRQVFHTPAVVSPLGVVPKSGTNKLRLIVISVTLTRRWRYPYSEWNPYQIFLS